MCACHLAFLSVSRLTFDHDVAITWRLRGDYVAFTWRLGGDYVTIR